jgi:hypothetical protein
MLSPHFFDETPQVADETPRELMMNRCSRELLDEEARSEA